MLEISIAIVISTGILSYTMVQVRKLNINSEYGMIQKLMDLINERTQDLNITLKHTHHTDKDNKVLISDYEDKVKEYLSKDRDEKRKDVKNNENPLNVDSVSQAVNKVLWDKAGLTDEDLRED